MSLSGFNRPDKISQGGLTALWLISAEDVIHCEYSRNLNVVTKMTFRNNVRPAKYQFKEGAAGYRQSVAGTPPLVYIRHEVEFAVSRFDKGTLNAVRELTGSREGVMAVVETECGDRFLVGWSPGFGGERPLRIKSVAADTEKELSKDSGCLIKLVSEDVSPAVTYTGSVLW